MIEFQGRVAVVTGAASGMGLAFANRFADAGMKLVLADVELAALARAHEALRARGAEAIAVEVDVMSEADVSRLADAAHDAFGKVHVLCNNAGVATAGLFRAKPWETPLADWQWVMGVNFMGVLHGIRAFVPRMLAHGERGHVVNTASVAGLLTSANPYHVSKHAVVCLTEGLYKEFRLMGANLSASVLCPGLVDTAIAEAERNRPAGLGAPLDPQTLAPEARQAWTQFTAALRAGIDPAEVAQQVFEAIRDDRFYIVPAQPHIRELVRLRLQDLLEERNPTLPQR
jgi:NAD(P)-dependent dehydrogenase (short-subunit alcohol dehydrogenase family)